MKFNIQPYIDELKSKSEVLHKKYEQIEVPGEPFFNEELVSSFSDVKKIIEKLYSDICKENSSTNYFQVVEMTEDEKFAMYMKEEKETIAKMLIQCNKIIESLSPTAVISLTTEFCEWKYEDYPDNHLCFEPQCKEGKGNPFQFIDSFPENFKFCHCCGKPIKLEEIKKEEKE
jgi:hypothetical protein